MTGVFSRIQTSFSGLSPANFKANEMMNKAYKALPESIQKVLKEHAVQEAISALTKDRTIQIAGKSIYTIRATRDYSIALVTLTSAAVAFYNRDKVSTAISSTRSSAANIAEKLMLKSAVSSASTLGTCAESYSTAKDRANASITSAATSVSNAAANVRTTVSNAASRASTTLKMSPEMLTTFVSSRAESCNNAIKTRLLAYLGIDTSVANLAEGNEALRLVLEAHEAELKTINAKLSVLEKEIKKVERQLGEPELVPLTLDFSTVTGMSPLLTRVLPTMRLPATSVMEQLKALKTAVAALRADINTNGGAESFEETLRLAGSLTTPVRSKAKTRVPASAPTRERLLFPLDDSRGLVRNLLTPGGPFEEA